MIDHSKPLNIQTSTGKPVYTGFSDGPEGSPYTPREHLEASGIHQDRYFKYSQEASVQEGKNNIYLAKHYKNLAAHHIQVSRLHGRKSGVSKAPAGKPLMTAGMAQKLKGKKDV